MEALSREAPRDRRDAFLALLRPLEGALYRFAFHALWDRSEAEDLLQDALLTAFEKFGRFRLGSDFRAWIFRIVANHAYNRNRAGGRRRNREGNPCELELVPAPPRDDAGPAPGEVESVLDAVGDELRAALLRLPRARRIAFLLRVVEGFRYREIAGFLGIPEGTVISHLARARAALRHDLSGRIA
ncbi:MAG: RNA polymerase sigma factor [Planctomycetales bacterium]|nr:RNA polymerase sigma factor [Planctomycetales bacterium]